MENRKSPRGEETFSTWARNKTSEETNETSEEMFLAYVENLYSLRGDFRFLTWRCILDSLARLSLSVEMR